jgi:hypothetical protein
MDLGSVQLDAVQIVQIAGMGMALCLLAVIAVGQWRR